MRMSLLFFLVSLSVLGSGIPVDVYAVAKQDGSAVTMSRGDFEELLSDVNAIFAQVALTFDLRSYNVVSNDRMFSIESKSEFLDFLDSCPSTNGVPVYVFQTIEGDKEGFALENEGCCIEASAGGRALAHELGHMCGLDDIYASVNTAPEGAIAEVVSVREELAKEERQPMDWGRYRRGTMQGDLIDRMLMCGHGYVNADNGVDITAGDVYGVRIGSGLVTNAITGEVSHRYETGKVSVGFLLHGNRNPARVVRSELP